MIKELVYETNQLLKLLGKQYSLQKLHYITEYGSDYDEQGVYEEDRYFITTIPNIKKVYTSFWTFGSDTKIILDNEKETFLSSSKYQGRKDVLNIYKNKVISKPLTIKGKFIEVDNDLNEWLLFNGVTAEQLREIRIELLQEEIYNFPFDDVIFDNATNEICGTTYKKKLTIKESDLMKAIADIEDKQTAYKIQYILKKVNDLRIKVKN